jgi:hypothetical protein
MGSRSKQRRGSNRCWMKAQWQVIPNCVNAAVLHTLPDMRRWVASLKGPHRSVARETSCQRGRRGSMLTNGGFSCRVEVTQLSSSLSRIAGFEGLHTAREQTYFEPIA